MFYTNVCSILHSFIQKKQALCLLKIYKYGFFGVLYCLTFYMLTYQIIVSRVIRSIWTRGRMSFYITADTSPKYQLYIPHDLTEFQALTPALAAVKPAILPGASHDVRFRASERRQHLISRRSTRHVTNRKHVRASVRITLNNVPIAAERRQNLEAVSCRKPRGAEVRAELCRFRDADEMELCSVQCVLIGRQCQGRRHQVLFVGDGFMGTQTHLPPKFSLSSDFGHFISKMLDNAKVANVSRKKILKIEIS